MDHIRLFTPGPVPIEQHIRDIGQRQLPYNRTQPFSTLTHEVLAGLQHVFQTEGPVALLTASGTAAMEAAVLNFLDTSDRALVINGGTFGQRWCDLCDIHSIAYDEIKVPLGTDLDLSDLKDRLCDNRYSALLINAHETSVGHLYDIKAIGLIAREHGLFFIVDAISSICADEFSMDAWHVDVAILSSQKALALPPGLSFVAMNQAATVRLFRGAPKSMYLDLGSYLANQKRGQVPFTPAIGLLMQLHQRLADIRHKTLPALVLEHRQRAESFRAALDDPSFAAFSVLPARCSNAMTAVSCEGVDAFEIVEELRNRHNIVVAPSGGELKSKVIRVAHMGAQKEADVTSLISALRGIATRATQPLIERIEA
jgi:aspartate aminotransferase-like enzyme